MAKRKGLPCIAILEQRGSAEHGRRSGKDKGGFETRFHPHLTSPVKGEEFKVVLPPLAGGS